LGGSGKSDGKETKFGDEKYRKTEIGEPQRNQRNLATG